MYSQYSNDVINYEFELSICVDTMQTKVDKIKQFRISLALIRRAASF